MRAAHITLLALAVVALSHGLPSGKGKDNFPACTTEFPDPVVCDAVIVNQNIISQFKKNH
jgi:hypothetical protein